MIEITSLCCGYGKREVLKSLNLHLKKGELAGVLGPNGSGKSTLILALAGVLPYGSGSIRIADQEIGRTTARWRARHMACVPQRSEVTFPFKCLSVVLMGRYPYLSRWGGYSVGDMEQLDLALGSGGAIEALVEARDQGLTSHLGITGHGMEAPATHAEALRRFDFDTVLFPLNATLLSDPKYRRTSRRCWNSPVKKTWA